MKAVVYKGKGSMSVEDVDDPVITKPTDALLEVTSAAICGSDLHMYEGRTPAEEGTILGHEIMGTITEVGDAVQELKPGDRVVLPFNISCGLCFNCVRGLTNACLFMNPDAAGAAYGYAGMGPYRGGQAQKVLIPYADFNALKLPGEPFDEHEDDFLMLADIFPTAWHAAELAQVEMGASVAIYGVGPVGLLSILSARLKGASEIYAIDSVASRLDKAKEMNAIPINFSDKGRPSEQIRALRKKNDQLAAAQRPGEDKLLQGVTCGIDAIGYQARDFKNPSQEEANEVLEDLIEVVNPGGALGIIGVFMPEDPGAPTDELRQGEVNMNFGLLWNKGLSIGTGQCPVKRYNHMLRDLIIEGKAAPGTIVTHHIPIDEAPAMYEQFDNREAGIHKVVIRPNGGL
ncbi:MAG TPA: glutathione-independent formaldehyde dehydrogenase [Candidatus Saccharimonadales bacterium]|nr:glutathione-independent formaldehyde dehydrogenase [Candidatus Saccharimonadales bacterium]